MLRVLVPENFIDERKYVLGVMLDVFLGVDYEIVFSSPGRDLQGNICIAAGNRKLIIADVFFSSEGNWLKADSLPQLPLTRMDSQILDDEYLSVDNIPIIYGRPNKSGKYIDIQEEGIYLGIDVFGSAFFMLTRYEEYVIQKRDRYDRFPVEESLAGKEGFLERPIVNEYLEILWLLLQRICPGIKRKERKYQVIPTHDIDKPFSMYYDSPLQLLRHFAGDIIVRKSVIDVLWRLREIGKILFLRNSYIEKYQQTYEFIFSQSRRWKLKDIFFFMNSKRSLYDGNYTIDEPEVLALIDKILQEGHLIGLHPSFISYDNAEEIKREAGCMNEILAGAGLPKLSGARQHYLKWKNPDTWQYYDDAGIPFDSTLTFAGAAGFRAGVCYPYPVYNLVERKQLGLIERPLIIMDGTLYGYQYMGLSHEEAMSVVKRLAAECKRYNGEFVILWHNTMLDDLEERKFYASMLEEVCDGAAK